MSQAGALEIQELEDFLGIVRVQNAQTAVECAVFLHAHNRLQLVDTRLELCGLGQAALHAFKLATELDLLVQQRKGLCALHFNLGHHL